MKFVGYLPQSDPLFHYLRYNILPQMGIVSGHSDFKVYRLKASNHVYLYENTTRQVRIIGKFFAATAEYSPEASFHRMEREFNNLNYLRNLGFTAYPHYVPRPLGNNSWLNCLIAEEFCYGTSLGDVIVGAIRDKNDGHLYRKLTALAYFLATLHNRTATEISVDFTKDTGYFDKVIGQLRSYGHISRGELRALQGLRDWWRENDAMWSDRQVVVHGDATPPNFLFGDGLWVIPLDLERMKLADRAFDVGRLAAEIKHFFMQYTGNKGLAEPFIGHFLWEYACHFPDRERAFESITRRVPFYMGLTLLRIARNFWISQEYRRALLEEARNTLR